MKRKRRSFSEKFKAKVAIEALMGIRDKEFDSVQATIFQGIEELAVSVSFFL